MCFLPGFLPAPRSASARTYCCHAFFVLVINPSLFHMLSHAPPPQRKHQGLLLPRHHRCHQSLLTFFSAFTFVPPTQRKRKDLGDAWGRERRQFTADSQALLQEAHHLAVSRAEVAAHRWAVHLFQRVGGLVTS